MRLFVLLTAAFSALCGAQNAAAIPDVDVVDQSGHHLHFYTDLVQGKVVAINFIFTTCQTICSSLGANFANVGKRLGARAGSDIRLISISVDPSNDTPEKLREFAGRFGPVSGWTLVTGDKRNIEQLLRALGEYTPDKLAHSPTVLIGRGDGAWIRANGLGVSSKIAGLLLNAAKASP